MPKTEFVPVVEVPLIAVTEEVFGGKGGGSLTQLCIGCIWPMPRAI